MKLLIMALLTLTFASCASHKTPVLDPYLDQKGEFAQGRVGLDDKGTAIIQEEYEATSELNYLISQNGIKEDVFESEKIYLRQCRENMADPVNGGTGSMTDIPKLEKVKAEAKKVQEEFGLLRGQFYTVKKSDLKERLDIERRYSTNLDSLISNLESIKIDCKRRLRYQLSNMKLQKRLPSDVEIAD